MNLSKEQIETLEKYNIEYKNKSLRDLLIDIDWVMTEYLNQDKEPTEDFMILEKLYDEILDAE